jgi:hypothetical protein
MLGPADFYGRRWNQVKEMLNDRSLEYYNNNYIYWLRTQSAKMAMIRDGGTQGEQWVAAQEEEKKMNEAGGASHHQLFSGEIYNFSWWGRSGRLLPWFARLRRCSAPPPARWWQPLHHVRASSSRSLMVTSPQCAHQRASMEAATLLLLFFLHHKQGWRPLSYITRGSRPRPAPRSCSCKQIH